MLRELLLGEAKPSATTSQGRRPRRPAAQPAGKKPTFITSNERAQAVLVVGPADRIAEAKSILKRIDVQGPRTPSRSSSAPPQLKTYSVPTGTAEAVVKTLSDAFKESQSFRISTAGSKILVYATPEDQITIAKLILEGTGEKGAAPKTETISTGDRDPAEMAKTITGMLGDVKAGAPYVEAVTDKNAILVRGTEDQIAEVKADHPGQHRRGRRRQLADADHQPRERQRDAARRGVGPRPGQDAQEPRRGRRPGPPREEGRQAEGQGRGEAEDPRRSRDGDVPRPAARRQGPAGVLQDERRRPGRSARRARSRPRTTGPAAPTSRSASSPRATAC